MKEFTLQAELRFPRPLGEVFSFFADAHNLQSITPSWLKFEALTPAPIVMRPGTLIDYRITVHGLPIHWRTEIDQWDPPHQFVDVQLRGPYTLWHHTHTSTPARSARAARAAVTASAIARAVASSSTGSSCGAMSNGSSSIGSSACDSLSGQQPIVDQGDDTRKRRTARLGGAACYHRARISPPINYPASDPNGT